MLDAELSRRLAFRQMEAEKRWKIVLLAAGVAGAVAPLLSNLPYVQQSYLGWAAILMIVTVGTGATLEAIDRYAMLDQMSHLRAETGVMLMRHTQANLEASKGDLTALRRAHEADLEQLKQASKRAEHYERRALLKDVCLYAPFLAGLVMLSLAVVGNG